MSQHTSAQTSLLRLGTNYYMDTSSLADSLHTGEMLSNGPHPGLRRSRGDGFSFLRLWCWWYYILHKVWPLHRQIIALPSSTRAHSSFNKTAVKSKLFSCSQRLVLLKCSLVRGWRSGFVSLVMKGLRKMRQQGIENRNCHLIYPIILLLSHQ